MNLINFSPYFQQILLVIYTLKNKQNKNNHKLLLFKCPRETHTKVVICQLISQSGICQMTIPFLADV